VGQGEFGIFGTVDGEKFHPSLKGKEIGIKAGELGRREVESLKAAGETGIGPKLIASAQVGRGSKRQGFVAMEVVQGQTLAKLGKTASINGVKTVDAYWEARAAINKAGIAHNDTHKGNVIIDSTGKARFVDFGFGNKSELWAFAEAVQGVKSKDEDMHPGGLGSRPELRSKVWERINANYAAVEASIKSANLKSFTVTDLNMLGRSDMPETASASPAQFKQWTDMLFEGV
jgi:hypothetical protein